MKKFIGILGVSVLLIGCGGGGGVDANKTPSQIAEAVKTMNIDQIQAKIQEYKSAIEKKTAELEPVMAKLKEIPLTQMMGDEAKKLKADIADIKDAIKVLQDKLDVYVQAYNNMKK